MTEGSFPVDIDPNDLTWGHGFGAGADGISLHYVLHGRGPTVLLLHGWPGFWYDWRHVIPRLNAFEATVIAPDFRGFGDSDRPDLPPAEGYTPQVFVRDILALLDAIGARQVVIGAYDLGATVAQLLAREAPERVRALALFNPMYPGVGSRRFEPSVQAELWYQHFHALPMAERIVSYSPDTVEWYLGHFYDHWAGRKEAIRPAELAAIVRFYSRPGAFRSSVAYYQAQSTARSIEASTLLPSPIAQPTIVLWGEADPVVRVEWSDRLEECFRSVTLDRLPGVGHFVPIEAPDQAASAIRWALQAGSRPRTSAS